jgi:hypothetical protein
MLVKVRVVMMIINDGDDGVDGGGYDVIDYYGYGYDGIDDDNGA